jgi:hypothetical protein
MADIDLKKPEQSEFSTEMTLFAIHALLTP